MSWRRRYPSKVCSITHTRDLEQTPDLRRTATHSQADPLLSHVALHTDDQPEAGAVHERQPAQINHHSRRSPLANPSQLPLEVRGRAEVKLATHAEDNDALIGSAANLQRTGRLDSRCRVSHSSRPARGSWERETESIRSSPR